MIKVIGDLPTEKEKNETTVAVKPKINFGTNRNPVKNNDNKKLSETTLDNKDVQGSFFGSIC